MGVLNQSVLFHEGLHGYTGRFDMSLIPPGLELVFNVGAPSVNVTYYLEDHVIFPPTGRGPRECGN